MSPRGGARTPDIDVRRVRLQLYQPHSGQQQLHASTARFRCACCGRRWGKTMAAVNEIAKYGWEHGEMDPPSWWVAPTYRQALKAFTTVITQLKTAVKKSNASQGGMKVIWKSGAVTNFVSAERYDNLRGEGVGFMVVDEAAFIEAEAWTKVLRPMLSDTMGRALLIGTPKGKNWFYQMWTRGDDPEQKEYENFSFPTGSSPYIADSEVEEARNTLPADVFAQEYLADFLDEAAGVFRGVQKCVNPDLHPDEKEPTVYEHPQSGHKYVIGFDAAKHVDYSVVFVIDTDCAYENRIRNRVVFMQRTTGMDWPSQVEMVKAIVQRYRGYVLLDSTGLGDVMYDHLLMAGIPAYPYHFTNVSKQQLIQNLAVDIQNGDIEYPDIPVMIHELEAYQYNIGPTGTVRYGAPDGMHDDCVIGLALAEWAARHPVWNQNAELYMDEDESQYEISPI